MILIEISHPAQTKIAQATVYEKGEPTDKKEDRIDQLVKVHNFYVKGFRSEDPRSAVIRIDRGAEPYKPGLYVISDESYRFNNYERLEMGALRLIPFDIETIKADFKVTFAMIEAKKRLMAQAFADASKQAA